MKRLGLAVLALVAADVAAAASTEAGGGAAQRYIVVFQQPNQLPPGADRAITAAGGRITSRLDAIGVVGVESSNPDFLADVVQQQGVKEAAVDRLVRMIPEQDTLLLDAALDDNNGGNTGTPGPDPQPMPDPLGHQQWDKMRMNATATGSYALQRGRPDVRVAVLDTGAEVLPLPHPDLAPNLSFAESRAFVLPTGAYNGLPEGDPNPASWDDKNGHGSWCLSAVGAPINAFGISGVAPSVSLVALKVLGDAGSGSFLAIAAALVYAGNHKFDIASMSLGAFARHSDGGQALVTLLQRAINYARENGVLPISSLGNEGYDLSDGDFVRDFVKVPAELAGVVGVAATGYRNEKAFYSNYGVGKTDVSAPGGSTRNYTGVPGSGAPPPPYLGIGRVLGAWTAENTGGLVVTDPNMVIEVCTPGPGGPCFYYGWIQGTSMAAPNAAGVAALIISQYGDFDSTGGNKIHLSPQQVESYLQVSSNNWPCPEPNTVIQGPGVFPVGICRGAEGDGEGTGYNNFFGKGIVDAVNAVTLKPGGATAP